MISHDTVRVTTLVDADPETAFRVFTDEIDIWWKRGARYRSRNGTMCLDGEYLREADESIGRITAWEPGKRLSLELFTWSFHPGERTEVEVRFEPAPTGTRVTIEHRGWQRRPSGEAEFRTTVGLWWGTLLPALKNAVYRSNSRAHR